MRELRNMFQNPPKGGNGAGIPTGSPMAPGPDSVPMPLPSPGQNQGADTVPFSGRPGSLRDSFEFGVRQARSNNAETFSGGIADMRNYSRGADEPQLSSDPSGYQTYDRERESDGSKRGQVVPSEGTQSTPVGYARPTLAAQPVPAYRSDGKPNV